jgi:4-amino-4-deoxy-L-arabinose transferase-like glycosyltransferase
MTPSLRRDALWALLLFAAALMVRAAGLASAPLDGLYGQDAYAYYAHARDLGPALAAGAAPPPFFWPVGYPALLAAAFALFGATALTGQALALLMGAALAPLVYGLARAAGVGTRGALLAGLLMAANGQAIQSSLVLMADIPALFWACASALALLVGLRSSRAGWFVLAGAALGLAVITRWANLLLLVPFAAAFTVGRGRWRALVAGLAAFASVLLPQLVLSAHSPYPALNHAWVQGWSPLNALSREFANVDGVFHYAQINAAFYASAAIDPYFLAPILLPLIALGVLSLRWPPLLLCGGWALLGWLFLAGIPYQNIRFALLMSPPLAVLAGAGFGWLWEAGRQSRAARTAAALVAACALLWMLAVGLPRVQIFLAAQQADKQAVTWAVDATAPGATVYSSGLTIALQTTTGLDARELYGLDPDALIREAQRGDYVLVNRWQIENQWANTPLQAAVHRLEVERGLQIVARHGYYTLYRIGR